MFNVELAAGCDALSNKQQERASREMNSSRNVRLASKEEPVRGPNDGTGVMGWLRRLMAITLLQLQLVWGLFTIGTWSITIFLDWLIRRLAKVKDAAAMIKDASLP